MSDKRVNKELFLTGMNVHSFHVGSSFNIDN